MCAEVKRHKTYIELVIVELLGRTHLAPQHRVNPQAVNLPAQRTGNEASQLEQQEKKRLPIVVVEATVVLDLFWG